MRVTESWEESWQLEPLRQLKGELQLGKRENSLSWKGENRSLALADRKATYDKGARKNAQELRVQKFK